MLIINYYESVLIVSSLVIFNNLWITAPDTDPLEEIDHVDMEQELCSKEADQDQ